jgi:hypothetical protein
MTLLNVKCHECSGTGGVWRDRSRLVPKRWRRKFEPCLACNGLGYIAGLELRDKSGVERTQSAALEESPADLVRSAGSGAAKLKSMGLEGLNAIRAHFPIETRYSRFWLGDVAVAIAVSEGEKAADVLIAAIDDPKRPIRTWAIDSLAKALGYDAYPAKVPIKLSAAQKKNTIEALINAYRYSGCELDPVGLLARLVDTPEELTHIVERIPLDEIRRFIKLTSMWGRLQDPDVLMRITESVLARRVSPIAARSVETKTCRRCSHSNNPRLLEQRRYCHCDRCDATFCENCTPKVLKSPDEAQVEGDFYVVCPVCRARLAFS